MIDSYLLFTTLDKRYWQSWIAYFMSWFVQGFRPCFVHVMFSLDGEMWIHMTTEGIQNFYGRVDICNLPQNVLKYRYTPGNLEQILQQYENKKITVAEIWKRPSVNCVSFVLALMNITVTEVLTADELFSIVSTKDHTKE